MPCMSYLRAKCCDFFAEILSIVLLLSLWKTLPFFPTVQAEAMASRLAGFWSFVLLSLCCRDAQPSSNSHLDNLSILDSAHRPNSGERGRGAWSGLLGDYIGQRDSQRDRGEGERQEMDKRQADEGSGENSEDETLTPEVDHPQNLTPPLYSTPGNLSLIVDSLIFHVVSASSDSCRTAWQELLATPDSDGVRALDASGKVGAGFLQGNRFALGSYDECHSLSATQYCLTDLRFRSTSQHEFALLHAVCLPLGCSEDDIVLSVNSTSSILGLRLQVREVGCERESKAPYSAGSIVIIFVWCVFGATVAAATASQLILRTFREYRSKQRDVELSQSNPPEKTRNKKSLAETLQKLLFCFSLYETVPKIFATEKQPPSVITCLNGIRVISMCWIILGHISLFAFLYTDNITSYVANSVSHVSYRGVSESVLAVDSFFCMSGLLVTYLTLRKMEKRRGKSKFPALLYYLHRVLRLTPVYAFVLFSYWFLTVHLSDGPLWRSIIGRGSDFYQSCEKYWWSNLLYINNLYPQRHLEICMPWSWYLANDMQFYVAAPLIIIPLALYFPAGIGLIVVLVTANVATIGGIAGGYGLSANSPKFEELNLAQQGRDPKHNVTDDIYTKPWTRVGPYLIGMLMGFVLYRCQKKFAFERRLLNFAFYGFLWIVAASLCLSTVYGIQGAFDGGGLSKGEDILYQMLSRLAWSIALAIIVFACHNGYGWIVNDLLSMKFWIPLSRLTFTAYLVHGIVLYVLLFTNRNPHHADAIFQTLQFVTAIVVTFSCAAVIASFVEFPLSNLEEIAFKLAGLGERERTQRSTVIGNDCVVEMNAGFEEDGGMKGEIREGVSVGGGEGGGDLEMQIATMDFVDGVCLGSVGGSEGVQGEGVTGEQESERISEKDSVSKGSE